MFVSTKMKFMGKKKEKLMGFVRKATNFITHAQALQDKIDEYNGFISYCENADKYIMRQSERLYELRKESLRSIQALNFYVENLANHPQVLKDSCGRALLFMKNIEKADAYETAQQGLLNKEAASSNGVNAAAAAGAVAGGLTATLGPSAAMAVATAFGSTSSGVAISALGGAAATNAALAWLGGGAIAAGGGGMAAGSALLAILGPIGWGISAAGIFGGGLLVRKRNDTQIELLKQELERINIPQQKSILRAQKKRITRLVEETKKTLSKVSLSSLPKENLDYSAEGYPRRQLFEIVRNAKLLGKMSNEVGIICRNIERIA